MTYRNGTYMAFDGLGQVNPTLSDFKYYATIQGWTAHRHIDFRFVNSHDKTYAVRDTSSPETLKSRIRERLANSKNIVVILSSQTRKSGSMLSYEIEQAVDRYHLPLIITYVDYRIIAEPFLLSSYWPDALNTRISNNTAQAIHIPFGKNSLLDAIDQFSVHDSSSLRGSYNHYGEQAHKSFGTLGFFDSFRNTKK